MCPSGTLNQCDAKSAESMTVAFELREYDIDMKAKWMCQKKEPQFLFQNNSSISVFSISEYVICIKIIFYFLLQPHILYWNT